MSAQASSIQKEPFRKGNDRSKLLPSIQCVLSLVCQSHLNRSDLIRSALGACFNCVWQTMLFILQIAELDRFVESLLEVPSAGAAAEGSSLLPGSSSPPTSLHAEANACALSSSDPADSLQSLLRQSTAVSSSDFQLNPVARPHANSLQQHTSQLLLPKSTHISSAMGDASAGPDANESQRHSRQLLFPTPTHASSAMGAGLARACSRHQLASAQPQARPIANAALVQDDSRRRQSLSWTSASVVPDVALKRCGCRPPCRFQSQSEAAPDAALPAQNRMYRFMALRSEGSPPFEPNLQAHAAQNSRTNQAASASWLEPLPPLHPARKRQRNSALHEPPDHAVSADTAVTRPCLCLAAPLYCLDVCQVAFSRQDGRPFWAHLHARPMCLALICSRAAMPLSLLLQSERAKTTSC